VRQARNQTCLQQHTWNLKPQNTPTSPQFGARAMTENCDLLDDEWRIANMHALEIHHRSNQHHDLRSFQAGNARVQHIVGICTLHISLPFLLFSIQMVAPLRVSSSNLLLSNMNLSFICAAGRLLSHIGHFVPINWFFELHQDHGHVIAPLAGDC